MLLPAEKQSEAIACIMWTIRQDFFSKFVMWSAYIDAKLHYSSVITLLKEKKMEAWSERKTLRGGQNKILI